MSEIAARLGLVQRVLPLYRAPFFEALAGACSAGLGVFAGQPRTEEAIEPAHGLTNAHWTAAHNLHFASGRFYACYQRGLGAWLRSWDPRVLIVEANPRYLSTPAAVRWMRARSRPVIGWGLGAPGGQRGLGSLFRRRFLSQFDAMITYSQQGASQYCAAGFPASRVFVAPNAAAHRPDRPFPERPARMAGEQTSVLFVGRLQARKRLDLLLQACAALPEPLRPTLWIVGDGPARAELEALAAKVYPRARFLGAKHGEELEQIFLAADLFVLPGTGGLALQQAMAFGLPVMAGEADGTQADLVRAGNGWLLPPGDLPALTRALAGALSDLPRLRRMGAESFRIARDEINIEHMVDVFAAAVEAVI